MKFKKCASLLMLGLIGAAGILPAAADVTTPYSMYGYGILGDRATSMQRQMGGIGYAMSSGRQINAMNPASYASIDSLTFLMDMGADVCMLWSKEGNQRDNSTGGGLDYVTMQFPITKYMGASIGLLPYTSVGYAFGNEIKHGAVENQGTGGINMAYFGLAGTFKGVSIGANISYNFGNIVNDVYSTPETSGQSLVEHVMEVRDWDIVLGAQYKTKVSAYNTLGLGVTYSPAKSLHGRTWVTVQALQSESVADTVGYQRMNGKYGTPDSFGAGISFSHERQSRWMIEADVTYQLWSKTKYSPIYSTADPSKMVFQGMEFADRMRLAAGGEWVPKIRGNYGQRMAYRLGAYYCDDYLKINGNRVREYGITCGVGLHTPQDKTMINIGFEWKNRKAHPLPLITENYFNITLGVNFNERWFWQRKIR